ncbi:unnamed protein product [Protopolystoma xenopodis]|uniref:Uncharacterized protein n=1 Tax=Protopolystoma xenopodis TaxID=117903 RepID=A0A448XFP5_9PLAT|nr:unnamed protein product [Protopolystoma xenopodis]
MLIVREDLNDWLQRYLFYPGGASAIDASHLLDRLQSGLWLARLAFKLHHSVLSQAATQPHAISSTDQPALASFAEPGSLAETVTCQALGVSDLSVTPPEMISASSGFLSFGRQRHRAMCGSSGNLVSSSLVAPYDCNSPFGGGESKAPVSSGLYNGGTRAVSAGGIGFRRYLRGSGSSLGLNNLTAISLPRFPRSLVLLAQVSLGDSELRHAPPIHNVPSEDSASLNGDGVGKGEWLESVETPNYL